MAKVKQIKASEILDSRGNPTVEAVVILSDGATGVASCPTGASIGTYEAVELRDNDPNRYLGKGVTKAIQNIEEVIAPRLIGIDAAKLQEIDKVMIEIDGTQNKSKLGANATLSVSMAACKAAAKSSVLPLFLYLRQFIKKEGIPLKVPSPLFNMINGGKHADGNLDFQEFIVIPAAAKPYSESLHIGFLVYNSLKNVLKQRGATILIGDEGGFGPKFATNADALLVLKQAIDEANIRFGFDVFLGLDAAANTFYRNGQYSIKDKNMSLSASDLTAMYQELSKLYHFLYLEDGLAEDDFEGWTNLIISLPQTLIVGDDLITTNPYRLQTAISKKSVTGVVIKPNQIGTVLESLAVAEVAREAGLKLVVSNRSGETNDDFIADFAVAISADYVKFGAPARGERVAKYNRLLHIEKQLKSL